MIKYMSFMLVSLLLFSSGNEDFYETEKVYANHFSLELSLIKKLKIKTIFLCKNSDTVSLYKFDTNGYRISQENFLNKYVQKSISKYDSLNRLVERLDYTPNNEISFIEKYEYTSKESYNTYRFTDTIRYLYKKVRKLEDERLIIKSNYDHNSTLTSKLINVYDENWKLTREIKFKSYFIKKEFIYTFDSVSRKGYSTCINYLNDNLKEETKLVSYECDTNGNKIKNYYNGSLVSTMKYDQNNNLLNTNYFKSDNVCYKRETYNYYENNLINEHRIIDLLKNIDTNYQCFYNDQNLLIKVVKVGTKKQENATYTFHYEYYN